MEPAFRQAYANVNRWFTTCINQPQFKTVLGEAKASRPETIVLFVRRGFQTAFVFIEPDWD